jgi:hypothetical protein
MIDRYTKAILTVIALCLVIVVIRGNPPTTTAHAQSGPVHVIVDSVEQFAFQYVTVPVRVTN